jgi:pimeloyl-ACP methyl ester carboxylesterase
MFDHTKQTRGLADLALHRVDLEAMTMRGSRRVAAIAFVTSLLVTACGSTQPVPPRTSDAIETASATAASGPDFRPHFDATPCPGDVLSEVVVQISCGYLTVLEDRAKPDGRQIQLFVIRVEPPGGTTTPDPVILIGDLAAEDDYGGMAPAAQRLHRVAYLIDLRGLGHSRPSLDCPEVLASGPALAGFRLRDPARRTMLVDAVRACHDRLVSEGIDLAAYNLAANAEDIEDLRTTLGIASWNLEAEGDASRIAFEVASRFPSGVRSLYTDSPALPTPDSFTVAPATLDLAISRLVGACAHQSACARSFPGLGGMIRDAETRLDAKPLTFEVTGTDTAVQLGHPIRVVVDGAALVRWLRWSLAADGGAGASDVPRTLRAVLDGKLAVDDQLVVSLADDVGDCLGLLPRCPGLNFGVMYSILCQDVATQIDQTRLQAEIKGRPAYVDSFDPNPLLAACDVWPVGHPEPRPAGPVTGGVPALVVRGTFDPFSSPPSDLLGAVQGMNRVFLLDAPNASYNAGGYQHHACPIRNAWVDAPTVPPADTSCLGQNPVIPLGP